MSTAHKSFVEPQMEAGILTHLGTLSTTSVDDARLAIAKSGLVQEDFGVPFHRSLFKAVVSVVMEGGQTADPFTVKPLLEREEGRPLKDGEWNAVTQTLMGIDLLTASGFETHCRLLRSLAVRRMAIGQLDQAAAMARDFTADPNVVIAELTSKLAAIAGSGANIQTLRQVMDVLAERYEKVQSGEVVPIVKTGIACLDQIIGGWQPTLNLVAALPGVGKSAVFATSLRAIASSGGKPGLISLEDEAPWLGYRLWSHESGVNQFKLRFEKTRDEEHEALGNGMTAMNSYWDRVIIADGSDSANRIEQVVAIAQNLIINHKCNCIFVDHLGEVTRDSDERYDLEVAENLSALRRVANAHQVPMVVAMHLKRRDGLGPGDEPRLSDFANSAGAERKARVAVALSREPESDTLTFYVLKNTNGKAGRSAKANFEGAAAMLSGIERDHVSGGPGRQGLVQVRKHVRRRDEQRVASPDEPEAGGASVSTSANHDQVVQAAGKFADWFQGESFKGRVEGEGED